MNALSAESHQGVRTVVIEEIQVFPVHVIVRGIKVVKSGKQEGRLIVIADTDIQSLRLHRCDSNKISSCRYVILKSARSFDFNLHFIFSQRMRCIARSLLRMG